MTSVFKKIFTIIKLNRLIRELETGSRFDPQRSQVIRQLGEFGDPRAIEYLSRELRLQNLYAHKYEETAEEIPLHRTDIRKYRQSHRGADRVSCPVGGVGQIHTGGETSSTAGQRRAVSRRSPRAHAQQRGAFV